MHTLCNATEPPSDMSRNACHGSSAFQPFLYLDFITAYMSRIYHQILRMSSYWASFVTMFAVFYPNSGSMFILYLRLVQICFAMVTISFVKEMLVGFTDTSRLQKTLLITMKSMPELQFYSK